MARSDGVDGLAVPISKQERAFCVALGRRIGELRKAQGLTQAELAKVLGVAQQTLNSYEKGVRRVPLYALPALTQALGVSAETLFGQRIAPGKRGPAPKLQQQLERLSRLPRTKQRFVSDMLDTVLKQAS
ncbi:MAG: helix-turn-helix domain-containing protein [Candidatus Acidiferrales bacterium]